MEQSRPDRSGFRESNHRAGTCGHGFHFGQYLYWKSKKIVKNLNSALCGFSEGRPAITASRIIKVTLFADGHEGKLKEGDEIIVQVAKDAVKTKDPVLTGNLNFPVSLCGSDCRKTDHWIFVQD